MMDYKKTLARPISPHLQIYNIFSKTMSSGPSIIQRITGVILVVGLIYLCAWLFSAAMGENSYNLFLRFITSWFGYLSLLGFSLCFYYHIFNGIRFLIFNLGYWLTKKNVMISGWCMVVITLLVWIVTWLYVFNII